MKTLLFFFCLLITLQTTNAQVRTTDITKVNTPTEAQEFIESHPGSEGKLISVMPGEDLAEISPMIFKYKTGYIFNVGNYTYKIVNVDSLLSFRVSYIFLAGEKYTKTQADKLRNEIIAKYRSGTKFTDLSKKYTMDGNKTGDTNWFIEKAMVAEFEKSVREHKKGDIFSVDTPGMNWYHVVLKTYDDAYVKKLTLLKVKSSS